MIRFLRRFLFFSFPLIVTYIYLIFYVDPYNYFNLPLNLDKKIKSKYLKRSDMQIHYWVEYRQAPTENIIIGSSRAEAFNIDTVNKASKSYYTIFSISGGDLTSIITAFWEAAKITRLKNVYLDVSLTQFDTDTNKIIANPMKEIVEKSNSPLLFLGNTSIKQAFNWVTNEYFSIQSYYYKPLVFKPEEQWNYFLINFGDSILRTYKYDSKHFLELNKIKLYCKENAIKLNFIIFPNHKDLHDCRKKYNLTEVDQKFKQDVRSLGTVYDFDYPNEITNNRDFYKDPFHSTPEITNKLTHQIWENCTLCK
jgi:hypothetical protein